MQRDDVVPAELGERVAELLLAARATVPRSRRLRVVSDREDNTANEPAEVLLDPCRAA